MKYWRFFAKPFWLHEKRFLVAVVGNRGFSAGLLLVSLLFLWFLLPASIAMNVAPPDSGLSFFLRLASTIWILSAVPRLWNWYCMMGEIENRPGSSISNVLARKRLKNIEQELKGS